MPTCRSILLAAILPLLAAPLAGQILFASPILSDLPGGLAGEIATGDVDGDGFGDVVLFEAGQPLVRLGLGTGEFGPMQSIGQAVTLQSAELSDLDEDGDLDLVGAMGVGFKQLLVMSGAGDGTFSITQNHPLGTGAVTYARVRVQDADADGDADVLASVDGFPGQLRAYFNSGTGLLTSNVVVSAAEEYHHFRAGDLDGDGLIDVVEGVGPEPDIVKNLASVRVQQAQPGGTFAVSAVYPKEVLVTLADLDGDGLLDLLTENMDTDLLITRLGAGDGTFVPGPVAQLDSAARAVLADDLDEDGILDVVVAQVSTLYTAAYTKEEVAFLRGSGGGRFDEFPAVHVSLGQQLNPEWHVLGDLDGDGRKELLALRLDIPDVTLFVTMNRTYPPGGPLLDLGHQLKSPSPWTIQIVSGQFTGGDPVKVSIAGLPWDPAFVVVGTSEVMHPFAGGTLVPLPQMIIGPVFSFQQVDTFVGSWPPSIPSGTTVTLQSWMKDDFFGGGWASTSATRITAP